MSLVNDMLRDLDRRKRFSTGAAASVYNVDREDEASFKANWIVLVLVVVGVIVGVASGYIFFKQPSTNQTIQSGDVVEIVANQGSTESEIMAPTAPVENIINTNSISIFENDNTADGFQVKIVSTTELSYEVISRNEFGINVLLPEILNVTHNDVKVAGFSFSNSNEGMALSFDLNEKADFQIYTENNSASGIGTSLIIEAVVKSNVQESSQNSSVFDSPVNQQATYREAEISGSTEEVVMNTNDMSAPSVRREDVAPVRTVRELSFEDQDLQISQDATNRIQRGQMMSAYEGLLEFIGNNEEAHLSRETLATLLFAQQEYAQANIVVDQGLNLAPNYSAYKKIKARLYFINNEAQKAAQFLENYPPDLAADPEYFELLASAFQQSGQFSNAIETYQNLIRYDSTQAKWWVGMGVSLEADGNVDDAIASYQAAIQGSDLESALRQYSQNRIRYLKN